MNKQVSDTIYKINKALKELILFRDITENEEKENQDKMKDILNNRNGERYGR